MICHRYASCLGLYWDEAVGQSWNEDLLVAGFLIEEFKFEFVRSLDLDLVAAGGESNASH